jgi:drug/metabolite transporter (DMT)-like permease
MPSRAMDGREWLLLVTLALLWGGAFFLTEIVLLALPPLTAVLGRVGLAAIALLALVRLRGWRMPADRRVWGAFLVMGLLNNALPFSLIVAGQTEITGGLAAILNSTSPLFSLLLAHFVTGHERISANRLAGLLLGIVGVVVLMGPQALRGLGAAGLGQLAVLGAAFCYACAALYGRRFRQLPPLMVAAGQLTCATLLIAPAALVIDRPWTLAPGLSIWAALLTMALGCTAAAYLIYFRLLATAGATNLLLVTLLIPVGALALGAAFLAEPITPGMLAGMALIFAGLGLIDGRVLRHLRLSPATHPIGRRAGRLRACRAAPRRAPARRPGAR